MGFWGLLNRKKRKKIQDLASGNAIENAISIQGVPNHVAGVLAEYQYLSQKFGRRGVDWEVGGQTLLQVGRRRYDKMDIIVSDGTHEVVIFDITEFFGKR